MQINIAKSSGFCFGVRRAIDTCLNIAKQQKRSSVLGDIVHNHFIVQELNSKGIKKIDRITPAKKKNDILIISAHGAPKRIFQKARSCGYIIIDATCPKVKDIYKIALGLEKNNQIIIIGDANHQETIGIAGQLKKKSIIIESPNKIPVKKLNKIKKAAVVTQSTQTLENINSIMDKLKKCIPEVKLYNTVCRTTIIKQQEIKTLPKENDLVLVVGSSTSANTRQLYEIAKLLNQNTHWIENANGLKKGWFSKIKTVGIMAGASTPDIIVEKIIENLKTDTY